jgi:hypothetical protein
MASIMPDDDVELRYEIPLALRTQNELDPIEAWLKLNVNSPWKMEFDGVATQPNSGEAQRLRVVFCFADKGDAQRFQRDRAFAHAMPDDQLEARKRRRMSEVRAMTSKPATPRPSSRPTNSDRDESRSFVERAGNLVRGSDQVMASKVQLIGLDRLKEHFGDSWSRIAVRADQIAERSIRKSLGDRDIMTKVHDLNYLVLFADASQDEAQLRCRIIASDIARQLIGEDASGELLTVKTGVAPVDGDTSFEDAPNLDDLVSRLVAESETGSVPIAAAPAVSVAASDTAGPLAAVEFVYRPMWDVRRKVVTSFLCVPAVRLAGGRRVIGESAIAGIDTEQVQRALDRRILERAITDLLAAFNADRKHLIAVPVHFETVSTSVRRLEYLRECQRLPPVAAKLLLFEVVGAPDGVTQGRLLEITTALRAVARGVIFRASIWSTGWGDLGLARIVAVGADLSSEHASETVLVERLVKFADAADKRKLGSYLHGLRTLSLTVSAVGAGFHHLSGQPIATLADAPPDAHRFSLADLYDAITPST